MAFAATIQRKLVKGNANSIMGTWTGTAGDASGTVTGSGNAISAEFLTNLASGGPANPVQPQIVNSSGTWTVTVPYSVTVTGGTFVIDYV